MRDPFYEEERSGTALKSDRSTHETMLLLRECLHCGVRGYISHSSSRSSLGAITVRRDTNTEKSVMCIMTRTDKAE